MKERQVSSCRSLRTAGITWRPCLPSAVNYRPINSNREPWRKMRTTGQPTRSDGQDSGEENLSAVHDRIGRLTAFWNTENISPPPRIFS